MEDECRKKKNEAQAALEEVLDKLQKGSDESDGEEDSPSEASLMTKAGSFLSI